MIKSSTLLKQILMLMIFHAKKLELMQNVHQLFMFNSHVNKLSEVEVDLGRPSRVIVSPRVFLLPRPLATTSRCLRGSCDRSTALRLSWRRGNLSCLAPKLKAQLAKLLKLEGRPCQHSAQERSSTMSGAGSRPQRGEEPRRQRLVVASGRGSKKTRRETITLVGANVRAHFSLVTTVQL